MFTKKTHHAPEISDEAIAQRAYLLWETRGCPEGDGSDDWQTAKAELEAEAQQPQSPVSRLFAKFRNRAAL